MAKNIDITHLGEVPRRFVHPLPVKYIGHVKLDHDRYSGYHRNTIEFCLRLSSSEECAEDWVENILYRTPFPHLFIKRPMELHTYSYNAFREAFFIIYSASLLPSLKKFGISPEVRAVHFSLTPKIGRLMQQLRELLQESEVSGVADEIDCLAQTLLVAVFNSRSPEDDPKSRNGEILQMQKISSYLKSHYTENINMEQLARKFGFSQRNFYRLWKRNFAVSPAKYVIELKIAEACRLLENSSLSVKEIAVRLNFVDSTYFIAAFKRHLLQTPLAYRNKMYK